jgi:sugar phosphate isomerase/epimerase
MSEIARDAGVQILEVEYITAWGTAADRDDAQRRKEETVFTMARAFGVGHLNTGIIEKLPIETIVEAFAELCDRAGDDLTIALEFMPYSGVPDLATAWRVLQEANRRNSALIVDVWHWARAGMMAADLDSVPRRSDRVRAVVRCPADTDGADANRVAGLSIAARGGLWRRRRPGPGAAGKRRAATTGGGGGHLRRTGGPGSRPRRQYRRHRGPQGLGRCK